MPRSALSPLGFLTALTLLVGDSPLLLADNPPRDNNRELHVVGLYEGATKTAGEIHGPRAVVTVDRPRKLVTLVLSSHSAITWEIKLAPGSSVEKIILGGNQRQAVKGAPSATEMVNAAREGGSGQLGNCYKLESGPFRALVHQLSKLSDLEISSFQGSYRFSPESPIVVDTTQDDPRLLRSYPQPLPLARLPKLDFKALRYASDPQRPFGAQAEWGDYTLGGPEAASFKPLPQNVKRLAFDPHGKRHYGIAGNDLVEVDPVLLTAQKLEPGQDLPRIGRPSDVTFDTRRRRLLIAGEFLHAYEPATGRWSLLAERPDVAALTYHAALDRVFAIALRYSEDGNVPWLCEFNSHGALIKQSELSGPIVPGCLSGHDPTAAQLVSAGEHLVLLVSPHGRMGGEPVGPKAAYRDRPASSSSFFRAFAEVGRRRFVRFRGPAARGGCGRGRRRRLEPWPCADRGW